MEYQLEYNIEVKFLAIMEKNFDEDLIKYIDDKTKLLKLFDKKSINMKKRRICKIIPIEYIPNETQHIYFCCPSIFNKKIDNLPQNLIGLFLGSNFNQKLDNLPKNLSNLSLSRHYNNKINKLPKNLLYLKFFGSFNNKINIPKNLKILHMPCHINLINNIPKHIEKIHIDFNIIESYNKKVENLPFTLKEIVIKSIYEKYVKVPFGCILTLY